MSNEYVIQKKTLAGWSYVTWYDNLEQARRNFAICHKDSGYSWRIVKLELIEERLLNDVVDVKPDEDVDAVEAPVKSDWGTPSSNWGKPAVEAPKAEHGLSGSVWLGNPSTKEKKRVPAEVAAAMMADGWIKAGPRTII